MKISYSQRFAELYRVFQPYRLGDDFGGCSCCVNPTDCDRLRAIPLRELTVDDLNRYSFKAISTWGEVRHFKYFLPRLLELAWDEFQQFDAPETLLGKLPYAQWRTWPAIEQDAMANYLPAWFRHQITLPKAVEPSLGGLANAGESLRPYLADWLTLGESGAVPLAALIEGQADWILNKGRAFLWGDPPAASQELIDWIASAGVRDYLDIHAAAVDAAYPFARSLAEGIRAARGTS